MKADNTAPVVSFAGHETFVFRYSWLKKAVDAAMENPRIFGDDDAIVVLGVGKNMVRSIRHWALSTGVLDEEPKTRGRDLHPSKLGRFLFADGGHDPYLEDPNSLWILHWNLVARPERCTTWYWGFHKLLSNEFTRQSLLQGIQDELRLVGATVGSESTLKRDIEVFVRTYLSSRPLREAIFEDTLDCPLTELGLLEQIAGSDMYQIKRGPKSSLSNHVFAYALMEFWERVAPEQESLAFNEIAYAGGSPGNAFKLDENSLVERLEALDIATQGAIIYTETAGLKQVYRKGPVDKFDLLERHYQSSDPLFIVGA